MSRYISFHSNTGESNERRGQGAIRENRARGMMGIYNIGGLISQGERARERGSEAASAIGLDVLASLSFLFLFSRSHTLEVFLAHNPSLYLTM
jgi:hypothetical protein